ncbi:MAG: glycosyltransferase family 4 protein [Thermoplasmatota archaeon]
MKILVIPTTDWVGHPVPNRLNFIFERLVDNHTVHVCHFKLFEEKIRNTRCKLIPMDKERGYRVSRYYLARCVKHANIINKIAPDYDIIVSTNIIPSFFANLQDTPMVFDYMDYLPESASIYFDEPLKRLARLITEFISDINLNGSVGIITPTNRFKEFLSKYIDLDITVIPNGVDTSVIHKTDSTDIERRYSLGHPVLGYVGSIERWIDLDSIIDIFPCIKDRYYRAKLLIIGPSLHTKYGKMLKNKVDTLNLQNDIIFTGRIPYKDLAPYISSMDVGLNPRRDMRMNKLTMGSKVLNYLACEVPVLSTNMPSLEEEFDKDIGIFVYNNQDEFLGELHKAIPFQVDSKVIKKYDWDVISKRYEKALQEFLE